MSRDDLIGLPFTPIGPIVGDVLGWQVKHTANGEEGYAIRRITKHDWEGLAMDKLKFIKQRLAEIAGDCDDYAAENSGYVDSLRAQFAEIAALCHKAAMVGEPETAGAAF